MIYGNPLIFGGSGSGGGPSASDAILTVTVPTGSTVTATKGSVTLTPTMWVQAADATLDCALFVIAPAQFDSVNPWTVTATLGANTASKTVVIDSNKEYDITIEYGDWILRDGLFVERTFERYSGNSTATAETGSMVYAITDTNWSTYWTDSTLDVSTYSTMAVVLTGAKFKYWVRFGLRTSKTSITTQNQNIFGTNVISLGSDTAADVTEITERTVYTLDLTNISGTYWLGFTMEGASAITDTVFKKGGFRVTDVYFMR